MALPLRVAGREGDGRPWEERTTTDDVSPWGASFSLDHPVAGGEALHLTLPLPKELRRFDPDAPEYAVYALVRRVGSGRPPRVGALFVGQEPPAESALYLEPGRPAIVERRHPRYEMFLNVKLRRLGPGSGPREEISVIENLSEGGAQEPTALPIAKDELVYVEEIGGRFRARAQVQNVHLGKDRIPRLNLRFVDPEASRHVKQVLRQAGILGLSRE